MKKLLYIDYTFSPLASTWRGLAFTKFLPEFGWQPIVVSAAESVSYDKEYSTLQEVPDNTEVHRVGHYEPPRLWQYVRDKLKIRADFPDRYKTWHHPAYLAAREILRQERVDLIYSVSPIFTTAFVAMQLKRDFGIPWVANFQDGWAVNDFLNRHFDQTLIKPLRWWHKRRIRRAEETILKLADSIVVVHPHVKQRWIELYGIDESKITVVTNGYDEWAFEGLTKSVLCSDRLTIVFLGSYYPAFEEPTRNFMSVVNGIDQEADVIFIGRGAADVHQLKQPNAICILNLPRRKALALALGGDFLFVVMPAYAKWTPTKTYDYLRLGKPILALVPEDGDVARIIREVKAGFVLSFDRAQMKQQLQAILGEWHRGEIKDFQPDWQYIAQFENRKNMERIAQVLNQVSS